MTHEELSRRVDPLIIIGDFNTTQHSRFYRQLTDAGMIDAHRQHGRGLTTTWPNGWSPGVPPIRVDQAMISPDLACLDISEGIGAGSDHKPVILEVALQSAAGAATADD